MKNWLKEKRAKLELFMLQENAGMGTVEVILLIVVLIGLVVIFKGQITKLVEEICDKVTIQAGRI